MAGGCCCPKTVEEPNPPVALGVEEGVNQPVPVVFALGAGVEKGALKFPIGAFGVAEDGKPGNFVPFW